VEQAGDVALGTFGCCHMVILARDYP